MISRCIYGFKYRRSNGVYWAQSGHEDAVFDMDGVLFSYVK